MPTPTALKNVIYLSNSDYNTLVSTGTVTIDGITLTYSDDNVYITPDTVATTTEDGLMSAADKVKLNSLSALPIIVNDRYLHTNASTGALEWSSMSGGGSITDVRVNNTSVVSSGVANIPAAGASTTGVVTTGIQTFGGTKTFNSKVVVGNPSNYSQTVVLEIGKTNSYGGGFSFNSAATSSAGSMSGIFNGSSSSYPDITNIKQIVFCQGSGSTHAADTYSTTLISSAAPSANVTLTLPNTSGTLARTDDLPQILDYRS